MTTSSCGSCATPCAVTADPARTTASRVSFDRIERDRRVLEWMTGATLVLHVAILAEVIAVWCAL